ncbi:MAG: methyltransferase domain-containing protein [Aquificae bacterium]|nr:methyltransferase domain-containing protein [Aquificota bacterium]
MKKLIYSLPASLFEIFAVEFNGYGIEILNRDEREVVFAVYSQEEELEGIKAGINGIFEELGAGSLILEEEVPEENWEEKWKENFRPIEVPPFIIIPEWEVYDGEELIPVKLKIGMAFGTGLHPSTQMALSLIGKFVKERDKVLDIGTGTGVLAVASAKLGAEVDAVDIQEEAVRECKDNAWENGVKVNCVKKSLNEVEGTYDTVLANLQIDIFREGMEKLAGLFKKYLIISGIYGQKEREELLKMAEKHGLNLIEQVSKKGEAPEGGSWYAFVFTHKQVH